MKELLPEIHRSPLLERVVTRLSPEDIFERFSAYPKPAFLNSSLETDASRFSFIGIDPIAEISGARAEDTSVSVSGVTMPAGKDPFSALEDLLDIYSVENITAFPFIAGGIGYFGYDLKDRLERLPSVAADDLALPGMHFIFYRVILILDKKDPNSVHISVLDIKDRSYQSASEVMRNVKNTLLAPVFPSGKPSTAKYSSGKLTSNFSKPDYIAAVKKALAYIHAGDIYQVCLSQRFRSEWHGHPYELYRGLNAINPAPFSAFLDYGDYSILSSSPELFLRVSDGLIETRPMKGTRPRGKTPEEDILLKEELLSSAKDAAELLMIVDLERNDLGRSSLPGTVRVSESRRLEPHPTVFQTISVIRGALDERCGMMDVLRNAFPGGSITGCPKIRAMEIIEELEPTKRGIYTGSIGYISLHGSMDLNIAIRTMIKKGPEVYFQVGSGIVSDSDPETEYEETLHKARALIQAVS